MRVDSNLFDGVDAFDHLWVQPHGRFSRGLRMELGWEGNLEQNIFHDVAAQWSMDLDGLAVHEYILESPTRRGQRRVITHFAGHRPQSQLDCSRGSVAGRPALARASVGRMSI